MEPQELLERYVDGVRFPPSNAFDVIELLQTRSRLAAVEDALDDAQQAALQDADDLFLRQAPAFHDGVSGLGDMDELRRRHQVPRLHWWWHLERLM